MNKAFEKIMERLEAESFERRIPVFTERAEMVIDFETAKQVVQEVAEEYNNGWISCSERLPGDDSICIVTVEYPDNKTMVDYGWFDRKRVCWFIGMQEFRTSNILAWQPLPEPYKERD